VVDVRGRDVEIQYDVEEGEDGRPTGVARLRLPEKLARTLVAEEVPELDRPLRFVVLRGPRGAVRARTLDELQEQLDLPWSPAEADGDGGRGDRDEASAREYRRRERDERTAANALRRHSSDDRGRPSDGRGSDGRGSRGPGGPGRGPGRGPKRGPGAGPAGRRRGR
jgi:hypothetical protein